MPVQVVVVRHGERLDEVDKETWRSTRTQENYFDPPLTEAGWKQAASAGRQLWSVLPQGAAVTIYSSPTARTLSTAAGIAASLKVGAVTPAYALNCCAAAQSHGVSRAFPQARPPEGVMRSAAGLARWPPAGDPEQVDLRHRRGLAFQQAVAELARQHGDGEVVVMVTHREGMWQLASHVGRRASRAKYCDIHFYCFDPAEGVSASELVVARRDETPPPALPVPCASCCFSTPPRRRRAAEAVAAGQEEADPALRAALAQGCGRVMMQHGGRASQHGGPTRLWRTPGVEGVYADGGPVPDGEVVELLSCAQPSENGHGDFVHVRRDNGAEGWAKVKHVCLPT